MGREPIIQAVVEEAAALAAVALRLVHDRCLGASYCRPMKSLSVASRRKPRLQFRRRFDILRLVLDQRPQPPMTVLGNAVEATEEARERDRSSLEESIVTVTAQDREDPVKWRRKTAS